MKTQEKNILVAQGINSKGYGIIQKLIMQDKNLTRDAKCIYAYLRSFSGAGNTAFPSVKKICNDLCFGSEETFYSHMNYLKAYGYVAVTHRISESGKIESNIYELTENPVQNLEYIDKINKLKEKIRKKNNKTVPPIIGGIPDYRDTDNRGMDSTPDYRGNKKNNTSFKKNNLKKNKEKHTPEPVCDEIISQLKNDIKNITGNKIDYKDLAELLILSTPEKIQYHLNNWHIHKQHQRYEGAGWFFTVVEKDIQPMMKSVAQRDNFEQREYTDEELERYYGNLTE